MSTHTTTTHTLTHHQHTPSLISLTTLLPPFPPFPGNFGGINDHNFVVDRLWLDDLYRGLTEDYYFNSSLEHEPWGNPEHHILQVSINSNNERSFYVTY